MNKNLLDQFFLQDQKIAQEMVNLAAISSKDTVLEIGAGKGVLTRLITAGAKKTIAVEIDKSFKSDLSLIGGGLELVFKDALKVLKPRENKNLGFNKIMGNLPSSLVEPLIKKLFQIEFETAVFCVPLKFAGKLVNQKPYVYYFDSRLAFKVKKENFKPVPKTNWAVVKIIPRKFGGNAPEENLNIFLEKYCFEHPKARRENALREGLIKFYRLKKIKLTKKQAMKKIAQKTLHLS